MKENESTSTDPPSEVLQNNTYSGMKTNIQPRFNELISQLQDDFYAYLGILQLAELQSNKSKSLSTLESIKCRRQQLIKNSEFLKQLLTRLSNGK